MRKTLTQLTLVAVIAVSWCQSSSVAQDAAGRQMQAPMPSELEIVEPQAVRPAQMVMDTPLAVNQAPRVFYNHYLPPPPDGTAASMYAVPYPVPARVGQTQYTYEALLPHEYMYRHSRVYYTPHGTRDMFYTDPCTCRSRGTSYTKTSVIYTHSNNFLSPMPLRLPSFNFRGLRRAVPPVCE